MAKLSFNAAKAEPMEERSFTLLPEGDYIFSLVKSELVDNKKKTAKRLNFQAKVMAGEFKGNIVFIGLNWDHPSAEAQAISDREFKSICDAVGKGDDEIEETEELHGIPFIGTVKHSAPSEPYKDPATGEEKFRYGAKAEIKKYSIADEDSVAELNVSTAEDKEEEASGESKKKVPWEE